MLRGTLVATGVCLCVGAGASAGLGVLLPEEGALAGTRIAEAVPGEGVALGAFLQQRREALGERRLTLSYGDGEFSLSCAELGLSLDVAETRARVEQHARSGPLNARLLRAYRARRGWETIEPVFAFDRARAVERLRELSPAIEREATNARLDLTGHRKIPHQDGLSLDVEASADALGRAGCERGLRLPLSTRVHPPAVRTGDLVNVDVSKLLSRYETSFKGKAGRRAVNIRVAANYLDGTVIGPGEVLRFNRVVGKRTIERGFVDAPVIVNDEMEPGVGGGVCQVATTLHAAAVYGLLDVVRRRSHSRPSGYAPLGLDATVIDGEVDLWLKNPYDTPLIVHATLPEEFTIRVELLGREPPAEVEHVYGVRETHDFERRVYTKPYFTGHKRKQRGIIGYDVVSRVSAVYPDGKKQNRFYSSTYYPVPEVYWIGGDTPLTELPELPERASRVVIDGRPTDSEETALEGMPPNDFEREDVRGKSPSGDDNPYESG